MTIRGASIGRLLLRLGALALVVWLVHLLIGWTMTEADALKSDARSMPALALVALLLVAYALLIALPFVPGAELGITLMMVEGAAIAPFIWAATLSGLALAYGVGSLLPDPMLRRFLADLGLRRAADLVATLQPLDRAARLDFLGARLPRRLSPLVRGQRYVLLALLINLPGNTLLGGGGGILLIAGVSRLFSLAATLLTIAIAVAPVPILVFWLGEGLPLPGF
ncbi:hypothetical protein [Defluviimonas sp. SAOS-178_SWC]|uniref:hypothetical protein n=1 Tax=Defluviimonas sp. SAOS-178_SWC TaxID=3121287 RepID=UPI003221AFF7